MRRLLTWIAGAAGGLAAYRAVARRTEPEHEVVPDPADELRSKLAEVRETPVAEADPGDPDARRRTVHEHGRAALDEMRDET